MAIDYTDERFAFPKSQVRALVKQAKDAKVKTTDEQENAKARVRAKGQCEVCILMDTIGRKKIYIRCENKDSQTHHLKGGIGRRNVGDSILAINKLRTCHVCHPLITKNVLQPTTAEHDAHTVKYWRSK